VQTASVTLFQIELGSFMRILVYGFKPYGSYSSNITEQVLAGLPDNKSVVKKVFDVSFDEAMFSEILLQHKPDRVLGLGQHPRARKLRIERRAQNLSKDVGQSPVLIEPAGPAFLYSTLELPETDLTTVTYDAGSYVCNFSMYQTARYCQSHNAKFGFVHVPKHFAVSMVIKYVQTAFQHILQDR